MLTVLAGFLCDFYRFFVVVLVVFLSVMVGGTKADEHEQKKRELERERKNERITTIESVLIVIATELLTPRTALMNIVRVPNNTLN